MRLQKYMAKSGIASRRKSEEIILQGRVKVNGITIKEMGYIVSDQDIVEVDNKKIFIEDEIVYYILNKPVGYVTTNKDQFNRKTVLDLLKNKVNVRVYPVGRLDYNSSGLIIMTNDGNLTNKVLHPKYEHEKTYIVKVKNPLSNKEITKFRSGVNIGDYTTKPCEIFEISSDNRFATYSVTIKEGKNRQIRRMFDALDHQVVTLKRISIGPIELGQLSEGTFRKLSEKEVQSLKNYLK